MNQEKLVVDIGNTQLKFAFFEGDTIVFKGVGIGDLQKALLLREYSSAIVASVSDESSTQKVVEILDSVIVASSSLNIPIRNEYKSLQTLGMDRLANAVAIAHLSNGSPALAVDTGTCLKFDFVDSFRTYQGGSISPGLRMRFKAMHEFTANLPMVDLWSEKKLIGTTTEESLVSGVLIGMENEIFATIRRYQSQQKDLRIFMTGGDLKYFDFELKNPIFAHENLTLLGLKLILDENV